MKIEKIKEETESELRFRGISESSLKAGTVFWTINFVKGQLQRAYELGKEDGLKIATDGLPPKI